VGLAFWFASMGLVATVIDRPSELIFIQHALMGLRDGPLSRLVGYH
jgi:hypothetical protein